MARSQRTTLVLTRHGETVWHPDNRYAGGSSDVDLTPLGERQAQALSRWCLDDPPDAIICSPLRRARETAAPSARALGMALEVVEPLAEVEFGVAEGRTIEELAELDADMVARFRADPQGNPFPGAERPSVAGERGAAALRAIADRHAGGRVLVVAHNTLLRLAMCVLLGLPVGRYRQVFPRLDNAAITELAFTGVDEPAGLLSLNVRVPV